MGVGSVKFSRKKRYNGVRFIVISVTKGCVGVQFPGKKHYVTLGWPLLYTLVSVGFHKFQLCWLPNSFLIKFTLLC